MKLKAVVCPCAFKFKGSACEYIFESVPLFGNYQAQVLYSIFPF